MYFETTLFDLKDSVSDSGHKLIFDRVHISKLSVYSVLISVPFLLRTSLSNDVSVATFARSSTRMPVKIAVWYASCVGYAL